MINKPQLYPGIIFVVGDEWCRCQTCATDTRVAMRQYHSDSIDLPYLPLGPRFEFEQPEGPLKKASSRGYLFNFIGAPSSKSRMALVAMLKASQVPGGFIHVTPRWKKDPAADGYLMPDKYRSVLLDSTFTLCPQGNSPEAFRIFEAVESGSIPILALDSAYQKHNCKNAFRPLLESGAPFLVLDSWRDLVGKLEELAQNPNLLDKMQKDMAEWRFKFWSSISTKVESLIRNYKGKTNKPRVPAMINQPPKRIPLLTGCGRSGTLSVMTYLKSIGIPALHEDMRTNFVSVSWLYAADQELYPFETLNSRKVRAQLKRTLGTQQSIFNPVVHLTRHPLKVISSTRRCFCGRGDRSLLLGQKSDLKSWRFAEAHIPRLDSSVPLEDLRRSAIYWIEWNKLIERRFPDRTHLRLEDLNPAELLRGLEIENMDTGSLPSTIPRTASHVSPEKEKLRLPDVTWQDLLVLDEDLAREVFELAQSYGYELDKNLEELK